MARERVLVTSAMGQIERRKRRGRPPKPDLSRRSGSPQPEEVRTVRRSLRRRNVRYSSFIDYDDFIDDEIELDREDEEMLDEEDEDVEVRRGRKVKLVVKLSRQRGARGGRAAESGDSGSEAGADTAEGDDEEDEESEREVRVLKKRRIGDREEEDDELDDNYQEDDYGGEEEVCPCRIDCSVNSWNWSHVLVRRGGELRVSTSN